MPSSPNLAESPRAAKIRKYSETIIYALLIFILIPFRVDQDKEQFQKYLKDFNKSYDNETEYELRLQAFKSSLRSIKQLNTDHSNDSARYGLTKYSDMLPEEFLMNKLLPNITHIYGLPHSPLRKRSVPLVRINIPQKVDWRQLEAVTKVRSQDACGACWAFSVIGVIESMYAIKNKELKYLSVQQMIDCSKYNDGCNGGDICSLMRWIKSESVEILDEQNYPLYLADQECRNISGKGVQVADFMCRSFVDSEDIILTLLAEQGPVAVAINAQTWQNYIGGTIQYHCDDDQLRLNHAVEIVGYDLTARIPHYIVRNSWGEEFGDKGYLYIAVGGNLCGLAHEVTAIRIL
ncbi:unnamed protein product [Phaedon cochleariae]|uniref:Cathepsin O n=1 Tax=Phaedon cochleariae TaxID=80249 RepID=A0A9P0GQG5_PHACE|nr:unnamed protein product [Phaedon cochleariae]